MSIVVYNFGGLFRSTCFSYRLRRVNYFRTRNFTADVYNALQTIIVFLTKVPKSPDTRNV